MIYFVYRSHSDGPLSKRVVKLDAPSVLAWFAERIERTSKDPAKVDDASDSESIKAIEAELGGSVSGLDALWNAAREHRLKPPRTTAALKKLLRTYLCVEGGPENTQVDDHSVRVKTDDDEVMLAYYFFDEEVLARRPHHLAYLVHDEPRLPDPAGDRAFELEGVRALTPGGKSAGATYVCLFTSYDSQSMPGAVRVIHGVRLPGLAAHLRDVIPDATQATWSAESMETWPYEVRLLRAMIDPEDADIVPALRRVNEFPISQVGSSTNHTHAGIGPHALARGEMLKLIDDNKTRDDGERKDSVIDAHDHAVLFAMNVTHAAGFQQWVLFDDRWGAAHPALAASIVRYGTTWDAVANPVKARTPATPEQLNQRAWKSALHDRSEGRAYAISEEFALDEVIDHPKFGLGVVRAAADKIEVQFRDALRVMLHKKR